MKTLLVCVLVLLSLSVVDVLAGDMQKTIERDLARWEKRYGRLPSRDNERVHYDHVLSWLKIYTNAVSALPDDNKLWRKTRDYVRSPRETLTMGQMNVLWEDATRRDVAAKKACAISP